jgi:LytS/YehU family sensor histidine kinase
VSFPVDVIATSLGLWEGGLVSKFVFFAIFIMALVVVLLVIPSNINAAVRARELEAEQQLLRQELQESRISIMLSQMKPHFIFNTLNTIYHLCDLDPEKAKTTLSSFSTYLRNNINNLGQSEMIFFEKELSFVNTYLDIEKVRFDDELLISFDIGVSDFKLPVLTVQPIVENAVKHGTSKKEGVSHLYITTRETDAFYEIEIRDTGVGFDSSHQKNDGNKHIGIDNVRQRLKSLCNGTLTIESTLGVGTTALIQIPKTEAY